MERGTCGLTSSRACKGQGPANFIPYLNLHQSPGERDELLDYIERWLDRQFETLLEEWSPKSRMVQ